MGNNPFKEIFEKVAPPHISICHFSDYRGAHYHVAIPLSDSNVLFLTVLITSKVEKREQLSKFRNEKEAIGVYVTPKDKGFDFLRTKSLINHQNQLVYEWKQLRQMNVELLACDIDDEITTQLLQLVISSSHTKNSVKKAIQAKYSQYLI